MTLREIHDLAVRYAAARRELSEVVEDIRELQRKAVRSRLRGLRARAADAASAREALVLAVEGAPGLFVSPRTISVDGVQCGLRKKAGSLVCDSPERAIARIRKMLPDRADTLIRVQESLVLPALRALDVKTLASLGVRLEDDEDVVVCRTAKDDVDKLVQALLADEKAGQEE